MKLKIMTNGNLPYSYGKRWINRVLFIFVLFGFVLRLGSPMVAQAQNEPEWKLPWPAGVEWRMTQGVHPKPGHPDFPVRGYSALDLKQNNHSGCGVDPEQWVVAAAPGKVLSVANGVITIDHDEDGNIGTGWQSQYVHVANVQVASDEIVSYGTKLGNPSCIGNAEGSHLHFATLHEGEYQSWIGRQISGWVIHYDNGTTSLQKDGRIVTACEAHTCSSDALIVSDNEGGNPPPNGDIEISSIVRAVDSSGAYLDVHTLPENSPVQYHVAPDDVGIVTAGPVNLPDGRTFWEVQWFSGFYDLHDNPFVDPAPYPNTIVGWSDEAFLQEVVPVFSDVDSGNVFYPYIDMTFNHEIFTGYSDGTFGPHLNISRGGWAKGVFHAAGFTPNLSCGDFPDVPPSHEFYVEITTLKCLEIISGFSDGTFRPEENLLRDQATKFIVNALIELGGVRSVELCAQGVEQFPDVPPDNPFYDYIRCVRKLGIMSGFSDGTFRPGDAVTRGQAAKMLTGGRSILYYARWNPNTILECGLVNPTQEIYPGDEVLVNCNLYGARHLYGVQMTCTANSSMLEPQGVNFGNFFDTSLRFTLSPQTNTSQGILVGGVSQKNPAWPLFGNSNNNFAVLEHEALNPGTATLSCNPLLSDRDGFQLASTLAEVEVTILPFGGISSGIVLAQGRVNHAGITVEADGPVNQTATTNGSGHYSLDQLRGGEYLITADMNGYLPTCTTIELNGGGTINLDATTVWGGDAVDNDIINIGDATLIGANFNLNTPPADARADINADGRINIQDMSIMAGNFGKGGCQDW